LFSFFCLQLSITLTFRFFIYLSVSSRPCYKYHACMSTRTLFWPWTCIWHHTTYTHIIGKCSNWLILKEQEGIVFAEHYYSGNCVRWTLLFRELFSLNIIIQGIVFAEHYYCFLWTLLLHTNCISTLWLV
jgi:hypothetical protein